MVQSIVMINNFENSHVFILQQNELYTMRILICCTNQNDRIHLTVTFVYHKDFKKEELMITQLLISMFFSSRELSER